MRPNGYKVSILVLVSVMLVIAQVALAARHAGADNKQLEVIDSLTNSNHFLAQLARELERTRNAELSMVHLSGESSYADFLAGVDSIDEGFGMLEASSFQFRSKVLERHLAAYREGFEKYVTSVRNVRKVQLDAGFSGGQLVSGELKGHEEAIERLITDPYKAAFLEIKVVSREFASTLDMRQMKVWSGLLREFVSAVPEEGPLRAAARSYEEVVSRLSSSIIEIQLRAAEATLLYKSIQKPMEELEGVLAAHHAASRDLLVEGRELAFFSQLALFVLLFVLLSMAMLIQWGGRWRLLKQIEGLDGAMRSFALRPQQESSWFNDLNWLEDAPLRALGQRFSEMAHQINSQFQVIELAHTELIESERLAALSEERHLAAKRIEEREAWFRAIFTEASEATFISSSQGAIINANSAASRLTGRRNSELVGAHLQGLFEELDWSEVEEAIGEGFVELSHPHLGDVLEIQFAFTSIELEGVRHLHVVARDVTAIKRNARERKNLQDQLRHAEHHQALGTLAGGIAHDLNNLLNPIVINAELLELACSKDDDNEEVRQDILVAADRASSLVKKILHFSRGAVNQPSVISLCAMVKEVVRLLERSSPDVQFDLSGLDGDHSVWIGPTELQQVVMNLCGNAIDAIGAEEGTLTISTKAVTTREEIPRTLPLCEYVLLELKDTGHGMSPEVIKRIFEPYYSTKSVARGTGLGLATVFGIIQEAKGFIEVSSVVGVGSSFRVFLPRKRSAARPLKTQTKSQSLRLRLMGRHILVVDDELPNLRIYERLLTACGARVSCFDAPEDALEFFKKNRGEIDMLLTDLSMPKVDGLQLANSATTIKPGLPVVVCTGFSHSHEEEAFVQAGVDQILQKPINTQTLIDALRAVFKVSDEYRALERRT